MIERERIEALLAQWDKEAAALFARARQALADGDRDAEAQHHCRARSLLDHARELRKATNL